MNNIYELANNIQNDIFRYLKSFFKYCILFALGYFFCLSTVQPKTPQEITCKHDIVVEFTGSTVFVIPPSLPRTGGYDN